MRKNALFILPVLILFLFPSSLPALETQEPVLVAAIGKGSSTDRDEALRLAWKDAVRKATGLVMDSITVQKEKEVVESITLLSRGYINRYEILEEKKIKGIFHLTVKTWVRRDIVLQALLSGRPAHYSLDGKSLYSQALIREQQLREAMEILVEWLSAFKYENYLIASVSAPVFRHGAGEMTFKVSLTFDTERFYKEFSGEMKRLLDYVALAKESNLPMHLPVDKRSGKVTLPFERKSIADYLRLFGLDSARARKPHVRVAAHGEERFANIYLAISSFYFNAYNLPDEVFESVWNKVWASEGSKKTGVFFKKGTLRIMLKNKGGSALLSHESPLNINNVGIFPDPRVEFTVKKRPGKGQALFLIPAFGNKLSSGKSDYDLFPRAETEITIKVAPNVMRSVTSAACSVILKQ